MTWAGWAQYQHLRCVPVSVGPFRSYATVGGDWETYRVDGQNAREVRRDLWRRQAKLRPDPAKQLLLDIFGGVA